MVEVDSRRVPPRLTRAAQCGVYTWNKKNVHTKIQTNVSCNRHTGVDISKEAEGNGVAYKVRYEGWGYNRLAG